MKRTVYAAFAALVIIVTLYVGTRTVKVNCNRLIDSISYCGESTKKALAVKRARALKELWDEKKGYINVFVNHDTVREIDKAIANIQSSTDDLGELKANCNETKVIIEQLLSNEGFSLDGII